MSGQQTARRRTPEAAPSENEFKKFVARRKYFAEPQEDGTNNDASNSPQVATDLQGDTDVGEGLRDGVLTKESVLSEIGAKVAKIPQENLEQFLHDFRRVADAAVDPQPSAQPDQVAQATVTLDDVKGDATLLRQWHVYQDLLTTVVLPPSGGFKTREEAKAGRKLRNTYRDARARQAELGIKLVPENDKYIGRVSSAASMFYQNQPR